jgi:hypothetical protein
MKLIDAINEAVKKLGTTEDNKPVIKWIEKKHPKLHLPQREILYDMITTQRYEIGMADPKKWKAELED